MKRIAAILALVVGSQGCVGFLRKDKDGYYTNESVAAAMAVPVVIAVGVGLIVYAAGHGDSDEETTPTGTLAPTMPTTPSFPEEH